MRALGSVGAQQFARYSPVGTPASNVAAVLPTLIEAHRSCQPSDPHRAVLSAGVHDGVPVLGHMTAHRTRRSSHEAGPQSALGACSATLRPAVASPARSEAHSSGSGRCARRTFVIAATEFHARSSPSSIRQSSSSFLGPFCCDD
eukprot:2769306-Prymnesium_polylepis.1